MEKKISLSEVFLEVEKAGRELIPIFASRYLISNDCAEIFVEEAVLDCITKIKNGKFISSPYSYISRLASQLKKPRKDNYNKVYYG